MSEQWIWIISGSAVVGFMGALLYTLHLLRQGGTADTDAANQRIGGGYYKPMGRLLGQELRELHSQGFTGEQIRQLRASRRRVFRSYLKDLQADFRALHREARLLLRFASTNRPDLPTELAKVYFAFQFAVAMAHVRLLAHSLGIEPATASSVLAPAEWMREQIELLRTPSPYAL